jgi:hypothetical protein
MIPLRGKVVISYNPASKLVLFQTGAFLHYAIRPKCMYVLYISRYPVTSRPEIHSRKSPLEEGNNADEKVKPTGHSKMGY